MKYVIEHMEKELYEWSVIEYKRISELVGKDNLLIFNLSKEEARKLEDIAHCFTQSVNSSEDIDINESCVLDPQAPNLLGKNDNPESYSYMVFGGILGGDPPTGKTKDIFLENAERRNIGEIQMTTDNAVLTTKMIVEGKKFEDIDFKDEPEIDIDDGESVVMPFRYVMKDGKMFISEKIVDIIRKEGF